MIIEEIRNIKSDRAELRSFGITIGIVLCLLGIWILWRTKWVLLSNAIYFLIISAVLIFLGVTAPILLKPIHKAWMALSIVIGFFVSRIILSVLFYLVVTPIGLLARLLGKDLLNRNFDRNEATYWMPKKTVEFNKNRYENQF